MKREKRVIDCFCCVILRTFTWFWGFLSLLTCFCWSQRERNWFEINSDENCKVSHNFSTVKRQEVKKIASWVQILWTKEKIRKKRCLLDPPFLNLAGCPHIPELFFAGCADALTWSLELRIFLSPSLKTYWAQHVFRVFVSWRMLRFQWSIYTLCWFCWTSPGQGRANFNKVTTWQMSLYCSILSRSPPLNSSLHDVTLRRKYCRWWRILCPICDVDL